MLCIFLLEIIAGILAYIYYQQVSGLRDSNQGQKTAGYHPISWAGIGLGGLGPRVWLWFTFSLYSLPSSYRRPRIIYWFWQSGGGCCREAARLFPAVHLCVCFSDAFLQSLIQDNFWHFVNLETLLRPLKAYCKQLKLCWCHLIYSGHRNSSCCIEQASCCTFELAEVINGPAERSFQIKKFSRSLLSSPTEGLENSTDSQQLQF